MAHGSRLETLANSLTSLASRWAATLLHRASPNDLASPRALRRIDNSPKLEPRQAAPERAAARTRNLKEGLSERRFI